MYFTKINECNWKSLFIRNKIKIIIFFLIWNVIRNQVFSKIFPKQIGFIIKLLSIMLLHQLNIPEWLHKISLLQHCFITSIYLSSFILALWFEYLCLELHMWSISKFTQGLHYAGFSFIYIIICIYFRSLVFKLLMNVIKVVIVCFVHLEVLWPIYLNSQ